MTGKRIAMVGAGANGAAIAADIAEDGFNIACIEQWPAHVEAIRSNSLKVNKPEGEQVVELEIYHPCEVATLRRPFDIMFFGVKAYDTRWHCELMKPLLKSDGLAIGLQNGMTSDEMGEIFGPDRTLGAVIEVASNMFEPGVINRQTPKKDSWFGVGSLDPSTAGREIEVTSVLEAAGAAVVVDDIASAKWMKIVVNAAELVSAAILDLPLLAAINYPGMREVMAAAGAEALDAALRLGHQMVPIFGQEGLERLSPEEFPSALLEAGLKAGIQEDTLTAALQDWRKGRRAESEEINGLVVREQEKVGGSAPVNARINEVARKIESGELQAGVENVALLVAALED